jgi:AhpC/TSA family
MITILTESGEHVVAGADASGEALWCPARDAEVATGWEAKAEGLCQGSTCVPLPTGREREFVRDGRINLAALWRHLGQPALPSDRGDVWILARNAGERAAALGSLEAPDFALPDVGGHLHRLSDYRGKKVLLVTWASW